MASAAAEARRLSSEKRGEAHAAQKRFLREQDEDEVYTAYLEIERLRIASVYGGSWNGERIAKALGFLEEVKKWMEKAGK
jgi:hypothetical protein